MIRMSSGRKAAAAFLILTCLLLQTAVSCGKQPADEEEPIRYLMFMFTNKHVDEIEGYLPEMKQLYGEIDPKSKRMYAFGVVGPMLITQSIDQMRHTIDTGFDYAEKYDIPVYFQLDDITNYTTYFGGDAAVKFYEHPDMCEWVTFPEKDEIWGGQKAYGKLPAFWFNWGVWLRSPAFPNLASPEFMKLLSDSLQKGVLEPLNKRLSKLRKEGKAYLFAGLSSGWETHIPDYSENNNLIGLDPGDPPSDIITGDSMQPWEFTQYGYAALHSLGYDQVKLDTEAKQNNTSVSAYTRRLLYQVIHDFAENVSKRIFESGIPRMKIFTHMVSLSTSRITQSTFDPPTWCAVNPYSVPGFTMNPVTCPYDLDVLKSEIHDADPNMPYFGCVEGYATGLTEEKDAREYLDRMFSSGALVVAVFSYADMGTRLFYFSRSPDFGFNRAAVAWLGGAGSIQN